MESASGSGDLVRSHAGEFEVLSSPTSAFLLDEAECREKNWIKARAWPRSS